MDFSDLTLQNYKDSHKRLSTLRDGMGPRELSLGVHGFCLMEEDGTQYF